MHYSSETDFRNLFDLTDLVGRETRGLFLGPMPTKSFLDKFLFDPDTPKCPDVGRSFASLAGDKSYGAEKYDLFIAAITPFAPKLTFVSTHAEPGSQCYSLRPGISIYPMDDPPNLVKTDFSKMDLFVEIKNNKSKDPFVSNGEGGYYDFPFEKDTSGAEFYRGQLASCAAALARSQFRVHTFCVLMCAEGVRFIRWDRSGAIVTEMFNCVQEPHFLAEFFWRYSHLDHERKGYDTSISLVPEKAVIPQEIFEMLKDKNLNPFSRRKVVARREEFRMLRVPDRNNPEDENEFIIWFCPEYTLHSPFGRGTRSMLAYDMEKQAIVFLKDYWRAEGAVKEGDIYSLLELNHVPNIPPFGKGNDVRKHATITDALKAEQKTTWARPSKEMVPLRHYRMTLGVVGRPLTSFDSSRELVSVIADAMEAHDHAYFDANVLHRDISVGNILISEEGKGLLINWELCVRVDSNGNPLTPPGQPSRTGTWQFMSAGLLRDDDAGVNELADDRESCLYVLTWTALRYTKHTIKNDTLIELLRPFNEVSKVRDFVKGGKFKLVSFLHRDIPVQVRFDGGPHLDKLIADLTSVIAARYEALPSPLYTEASRIEILLKNLRNAAMDSLKRRGWLVETFKRHLDAGSWQSLDEVVKQSIDG